MAKEISWHSDGHVMQLELNRAETVITGVVCPNKGECSHKEARCVVDHFLMTYGLEINVGSCDMARDVPIAWTLIGGENDLDAAQVWVIPTEDITFAAWIDTAS